MAKGKKNKKDKRSQKTSRKSGLKMQNVGGRDPDCINPATPIHINHPSGGTISLPYDADGTSAAAYPPMQYMWWAIDDGDPTLLGDVDGNNYATWKLTIPSGACGSGSHCLHVLGQDMGPDAPLACEEFDIS